MEIDYFLVFGAIFFVFALLSRRIEGSPITGPLLFTGAGFAIAACLNALGHSEAMVSETALHTLAELTLVLVLAADASRISARSLFRFRSIPMRLLLLGLPMTIALGAVAGKFILVDTIWIEAALIAAILAPTDAALGASVLAEKSVPLRIRQSLNVESGLNDGISLPAVLFFACFLNMTHQTGEVNWLQFLALQLSLGPLTGVVAGWVGGHLIGLAASRNWISETYQGVAAMALALVAFAAAEQIGGNGLIAAFVCGLVYGNLKVTYSHFLHDFTETQSELLSLLTFMFFGLAVLPHAIDAVTPEIALYALTSLTVVRMLPVAISMIGLGLHLPSLGFLGWFGPRGLASLLFALLVLEDLGVEAAERIETVVAITVLMSITLHGLSSGILSRAYGRWAAKGTGDMCPENAEPQMEGMFAKAARLKVTNA
ncbi:MAG: cation:proton antiporter [Pseudomonadota bacterium]